MLGLISLHVDAAEPGDAGGISIAHGMHDPICEVVRSQLTRIPAADFQNGTWQDRFGSVKWQRDTWPITTMAGLNEDAPFKYLSIDVDNDRSSDVVVVRTSTVRGVFLDGLYLLTPSEFLAATKERNLRDLEQGRGAQSR